MKKIAIALLLVFATGILLSACKSNESCPAYGETSKYKIETRY